MTTNHDHRREKRPRAAVAATSLPLPAAVLLCLLAASPALCQDSTYQDSWQEMTAPAGELWDYSPEDTSDPSLADPLPTTIMVGSAVTEMAYDADYHDAEVTTNFKDQTGYTVSATSYADPWTRNEVWLPFDWDFPGEWDFTLWTYNYYYFNDGYCCYSWEYRCYYGLSHKTAAGSAYPCGYRPIRRTFYFFLKRIVTLHSYRREPNGEYTPTCQSLCTQPSWIPAGVTAPFIECRTTYDFNRGECLEHIYLCTNRRTPGRCRPRTG